VFALFLFDEVAMKLRVRLLMASMLVGFMGFALGTRALAQTDALPSWNDGPDKQAIVAQHIQKPSSFSVNQAMEMLMNRKGGD
jgi:hypothetical protein